VRGAIPPFSQYLFMVWCLVGHRVTLPVPFYTSRINTSMLRVSLWGLLDFTVTEQVPGALQWNVGQSNRIYELERNIVKCNYVPNRTRNVCNKKIMHGMIHEHATLVRTHKDYNTRQNGWICFKFFSAAHISKTYFHKINFDIILTSVPSSPYWSFSLKLPYK